MEQYRHDLDVDQRGLSRQRERCETKNMMRVAETAARKRTLTRGGRGLKTIAKTLLTKPARVDR